MVNTKIYVSFILQTDPNIDFSKALECSCFSESIPNKMLSVDNFMLDTEFGDFCNCVLFKSAAVKKQEISCLPLL